MMRESTRYWNMELPVTKKVPGYAGRHDICWIVLLRINIPRNGYCEASIRLAKMMTSQSSINLYKLYSNIVTIEKDKIWHFFQKNIIKIKEEVLLKYPYFCDTFNLTYKNAQNGGNNEEQNEKNDSHFCCCRHGFIGFIGSYGTWSWTWGQRASWNIYGLWPMSSGRM